MWQISQYIQQAQIDSEALQYEWDDWQQEKYYQNVSDVDTDRYSNLSCRANIALTNACTEWILYRYNRVSDDKIPFQYLEACWAAMINHRYVDSWTPDKDWMGPIRGPISVAILICNDSILSAEHEDVVELPTAFICSLAKYVLPNSKLFFEWREGVLERLEKYYPLDHCESWGEVVPREIFDLNRPFDINESEKLIQNFLSQLDYKTHPFLNSPEQMLKLQFEGTPYEFDIEEDRELRKW